MRGYGGNPWQAAANSYSSDLDQYNQIAMQGMNERANAPSRLYQAFMQSFQAAQDRQMQEEAARQRQALLERQAERQMMLAEETLRHNRESELYNRDRLERGDQQKAQDKALETYGGYNARVPGQRAVVEAMFKRAGIPLPDLPEVETAPNAGMELPGPVRPGEEPLRVEGENPLSGYGPAALAKAEELHRREQRDKEMSIRNAMTAAATNRGLDIREKRNQDILEQQARAAAMQASRGEVRETANGLVVVDPRTGKARKVVDEAGTPVIGGKPAAVRLPPAAQKDLGAFDEIERLADEAIKAITDYPKAIGWKRAISGKPGEMINQRVDPQGVPVRALLSNLKSGRMKERAGSAQTKTEITNLLPMTPNIEDEPEAALKKLKLFKEEVKAKRESTVRRYGIHPSSGHKTEKERFYSASANKTKIVYSDGTEELLDGRVEK